MSDSLQERLPATRHGSPVATSSPRRKLALLAFGALGIVYGDIGTSPLYAVRACFGKEGVKPTSDNIYGVLSLISWSLILVISVWYLLFVLRADNRGEGGILALMGLAISRRSKFERRFLIALGLFGAALLYGDGAITPAISVLGAVEGLQEATPVLHQFVIPVSVVILLGLFAFQRRGTAGVAAFFSPITLLWFLAIATLGIAEIVKEPRILAAVNPLFALRFFLQNGIHGYLVLGFVFLVVTGGEALYADLGHFGKWPIRIGWFAVALPALLVNYFGQGALLLRDAHAAVNPFYRMVPAFLLYPMVGIATAATIVASQAVISGSFSLTRQAVQLGYSPRMTIVHTSGERAGQIFVPTVNRMLMITCIAVVVAFRSADSLASAYGIAVSATMAITGVLFYVVSQDHLHWGRMRAALVAGSFRLSDIAFFGANIVKIQHGGWIPLSLAAGIYLLMSTWHKGAAILTAIGARRALPLSVLLDDLSRHKVLRVPGTAVFMNNADPGSTPLVLLHHLKHNKMLHERVVLLAIRTEEIPSVADDDRLTIQELSQGFYDVTARYGFMETPHAPRVLAHSQPLKDIVKPATTTYYLGHVTLIPGVGNEMAHWRKNLFALMVRNALRPMAYFGLPPNRVVDLGEAVAF